MASKGRRLELHKLDGPMFLKRDGTGVWYVNGYRVDSWEQFQYESGLSPEEVLILAIKWGDKGPSPFIKHLDVEPFNGL